MKVADARSGAPGNVVGVAFAAPASVRTYARSLDLPVPILCDPDRIAYRRLGFGRGRVWTVLLRPSYWTGYVAALARGRRPSIVPREDPRQLGGDAVLDRDLRLRWLYRSRWPSDRPSVEDVRLALVEASHTS